MNANELADDVNDVMDVLVGNKILDANTIEEKIVRQAAIMILQQQAELAELHKFLNETEQFGKFIIWNSIKDKTQK